MFCAILVYIYIVACFAHNKVLSLYYLTYWEQPYFSGVILT